MRAARISAKVHKWLGLLMAIQILFWFVSGLFFAAVPIEWVRSEHVKAERPALPVQVGAAATGLARLSAALPQAERIELLTLLDRPVARVTAAEGRPGLYDLVSGRRISPLSAAMATAIAQRDLEGQGPAVRAALVRTASPEYRGALPAWRIDFAQGTRRSVYVAADSGAVTARRSTLWRVYDFLWSLHIMDFRGHEDFNTPLLVIATFLGLIMIVTGVILFPSRLGYHAWRAGAAPGRKVEPRSLPWPLGTEIIGIATAVFRHGPFVLGQARIYTDQHIELIS